MPASGVRVSERGVVSLQQFEQQAQETPVEFYRGLISDLRGATSELQQLTSVLAGEVRKRRRGQ